MMNCYYTESITEEISEKLFLEKPPDNLLCTICWEVAIDPVQAICCGKLFCKTCQESANKQDVKCPHCRLNMKIFPDKRSHQEISSLKIVCPYYVRGCEWEGCVSDVNGHINKCKFKFVVCPNDCKCNYKHTSAYLLRKYLENHLARSCKNRVVTCEHCKEEAKSKDMEVHHKNCKRFPISCPNEECNEKIPREEKDRHVNKCPFTTIPCLYQEFGCATRMMRKDHDDHVNDVKVMSYHLSLLAIELKKEKEARMALEKKLKK